MNPPAHLFPNLELLRQEYVLVQAWRKTAAYIRSHNWYADTLELDRAAVNLPEFLKELSEMLVSADAWENDRLRIVPAPKSQKWHVTAAGNWKPTKKSETAGKLRPLAHVSLKDQVVATAVMLCMANRIETAQGDPKEPLKTRPDRARVLSYGNRLFCDRDQNSLYHRWGSSKLYRAFFVDYRRFLTRPETVAEQVDSSDGSGTIVIVHSDLRQFYDRVRPQHLIAKLDALKRPGDDQSFFDLAQKVLCWQWHEKDSRIVSEYVTRTKPKLADFSQIALPQGLVAAGFFSNAFLLDFDRALQQAVDTELVPGWRIKDVCRYVDDIRIVLTTQEKPDLKQVSGEILEWMGRLLEQHAQGIVPNEEKTQAALFRGDERPLVRQSRRMERIQTAISGGFDAVGGEEILDAIQGLSQSQERYSKDRTEEQGWVLAPVPDVRDETVARFAAARYRSTYRSLRPLLEDRGHPDKAGGQNDSDDSDESSSTRSSRAARSRADLDDETRAYALGLIENWVHDPSNVRLLRIGLDLWPAKDVLERILALLDQFTTKGGGRKAPRRIAWYCLGEVLRAGATETGFVPDEECLPDGVDIAAYREALLNEAVRLASLPGLTIPWYLKQQAMLFIAAHGPSSAPFVRPGRSAETKHYREVIRYLRGDEQPLTDKDLATLAILARRSFVGSRQALELAGKHLTPRRAQIIATRDPSFGMELLEEHPETVEKLSPRIRHDLCLGLAQGTAEWQSLAEAAFDQRGGLRNELSLLQFASKCLEVWPHGADAVTPGDVSVKLTKAPADAQSFGGIIQEVIEVRFELSSLGSAGSIYATPSWLPPEKRWRIQLGYLLRFILTAQRDFTKRVRLPHWREEKANYRVPESHWYQRVYGLHSGHAAFGSDWLPITDWTEQFLYALLLWPGCRPSEFFGWIELGIDATRLRILDRINELKAKRGPNSGVLLLPLTPGRPNKSTETRPLRGCVVQTVIPEPSAFDPADLPLSAPAIRRRHRNHLSAALAAVERMLDLRETHKERGGRLDLLILPELAVHPSDVGPHLERFARAHQTIILAGLTYHEVVPGGPLINSALWIVPVWSPERGLEIVKRQQGKHHLSPEEVRLRNNGACLVGHRPGQWFIGYEWSSFQERPLWLTASICYDATDIHIAADLREHSDIFAVPALNKDVHTFDHMALALHYHMYQMVIVANNGSFGGSNAYAPYRDPFERLVFHHHGQPQASVSFFEIDDIRRFLRRGEQAGEANQPPSDQQQNASPQWKHPPAGHVPW